jgi:hypothetical protein
LTWLSNIFSAPSDQARLIAILISAIVAVLVVLLNQWFMTKRAKRELLIEKVEELYLVSGEYIKCCTNLLIPIQGNTTSNIIANYDYPQELALELTMSINKMQMLCGLYFSSHNFRTEEYVIENMPLFKIIKKKIRASDGELLTAFDKSRDHIEDSRDKLFKLCNELMKKHGH